MIESKLCRKCKRTLPSDAFARDSTAKDGLNRRCRECMSVYKHEWCKRPHVRELQKEHRRRYDAKPETLEKLRRHKEAARESACITREVRKAEREAWKEQERRELEAFIQSVGGVEALRKLLPPELPRKSRRRFTEEENRFRRMVRDRWKYHTNVHYMLKNRIAARLRKALKRNKNKRKSFDILPYTPEQLLCRLRKTIPDGYTWQDFLEGRLHIDHIIPVRAFNFSKPEHPDFHRCWALSNLRLLSDKENSRKGGRLTKPFQPCLPLECVAPPRSE